MNENRVFYEILERVGDNGYYQKLCLIVWTSYLIMNGASAYINVFLFTQNDYTCSEGIHNCQQFVCKLPQKQRSQFISQTFLSLSSSFGDYRCDSNQIQQILAFIYIGGIIGTLIGSYLNQYFTKKKLFILSSILSILGTCLPFLTQNLFIASIGLFFNYATCWVQTELVASIMAETVGQQGLGKQTTITYTGFSIGATLNGLIFMGLKDWRLVLIVYQLLPFFLLLLGLIFFVEETPFDSIVNYAPEESFRSLVRIAKMNGKQQHGITEEQIAGIKEAYLVNLQKRHNQTISVIDLFRFDSVRPLVIMGIALRFIMSYQFNVPQLAVSGYSLDMIWSGVVIGSCGVFCYLVLYLIVDKFQRKKSIIFTQFLGLIISIIILIFAPCYTSIQKCGALSTILQIVGLFIYKFCINISYSFFYMAQFEMFPTQIRSIALQMTAVLCAAAVVLSPILQKYCQDHGMSIIPTFAISSILAILVGLYMPQTYKIKAPDIIKQLEYAHIE